MVVSTKIGSIWGIHYTKYDFIPSRLSSSATFYRNSWYASGNFHNLYAPSYEGGYWDINNQGITRFKKADHDY